MPQHVDHSRGNPGPSPGGGLLSQGGPAATPAAPGGTPTASAEEQPNVSPEEQQGYDEFVNNAFSVIYDKKSLPQILEGLKGDGNPVEGLANTG